MGRDKKQSLFLNISGAHDAPMFDIYCQLCERPELLGTDHIISTHRTPRGPVAYVHCSRGHLLIKEFRANRTRPAAAWVESFRTTA